MPTDATLSSCRSFREAEKQETRSLDTFRVRVTVRSSAARIINLHWREGMHDCCPLCSVSAVVEVGLRLSPWKTDSRPCSEEFPRILGGKRFSTARHWFLSLARADKKVTWRTDFYSNSRSFERYGKYHYLSPTSSYAFNTEWSKKMYTLFTHQYLWNKFKWIFYFRVRV